MNMKILTRYLIFDRLEVACINNRSAQPAAIRSSPSPRPVYKLQSSDPPPPSPLHPLYPGGTLYQIQRMPSNMPAQGRQTINTGASPHADMSPVSPVYGDVSC